MDYKLKELRGEFKAWLVTTCKECQDNGAMTTDYLIFTDNGNYLITGERKETLDISLFKSYLENSVAPQLNGEKKEKLLNITRDVKQYLNRSV